MKNFILFSLVLTAFSSYAEELKPYGLVLTQDEKEIFFVCEKEAEAGKCLNGNFIQREKSDKDVVKFTINSKLFEISNRTDLTAQLSCLNRKKSGTYLEYTVGVVKDRLHDGHTPFASINLLKEKTQGGWDLATKFVQLPMTLVIDDILHFTLVPVIETGAFAGKKLFYFGRNANQRGMVASLLNQSKAGKKKKISKKKFNNFGQDLREASNLLSCKKSEPKPEEKKPEVVKPEEKKSEEVRPVIKTKA